MKLLKLIGYLLRYGKSISIPPSAELHFPAYFAAQFGDEQLLSVLKPLGHFTFYPNFGNLGDIAIAQSTYQFFDKHHLPYEIYHGKNQCKNLVYGGGGMWHPLWLPRHLDVLDAFTNPERIVILPSSFTGVPELLDILDRRFTVFCREKQSYDYLQQNHKSQSAEIILDHDMVFRLTADFAQQTNTVSSRHQETIQTVSESMSRLTEYNGLKTAYFLRTDKESKTDWNTLGITSTLDLSVAARSDSRDKNAVNFFTRLFFAAIDKADFVVTDRLHVGIAAALLGKETFLADNSYGKVSGVYQQSLKQFANVHYVNDVNELRCEMNNVVQSRQRRSMILTLHRITEQPKSENDYDIRKFKRLLHFLRTKKVVYLDDYEPVNANHVVLCFDDGTKDLLTVAPLLHQFRYPFEVFVCKKFIDNGCGMNAEQLQQIVRYGGRLQYHSKTHPKLNEIPESQLDEEIRCPDEIRALDAAGFNWFAYPYWRYNDAVVDVVKKYYRGAVSGNGFTKKWTK